MTLGLIGKKLGMSRIYSERGSIVPVTVLQAGPCRVLQVKRGSTDGYSALQIGFGSRAERKVNKPMAGHFKKAGADPARVIREFRIDDVNEYDVGKSIDVGIFKVGEKVDVTGISKGRGFAGTIKRHKTSRGPETHGSHYHRRPGSMGGSADPSRVWKGKKLPGRMGGKRSTVQNLLVVQIDTARNLILVRGAVPGHNDGYVMVAKSKKGRSKAA